MLNDVGKDYHRCGRLAAARDCFEQAHTIIQKAAPGSLALAESLDNLGALDASEGNLRRARSHYQEARGIHRCLPHSEDRRRR